MPESQPPMGPARSRLSAAFDGPLGWIIVALWLGLAVGIAEVGTTRLVHALGVPVRLDQLRTNRHSAWMIPVADAGILVALGLLLAGVASWRPGLARRLSGLALGLPTFVCVLYYVPGLHKTSCWILCLGLGVQAGRLARRHPSPCRAALRWTLPALLLAAAVLGPIEYFRVVGAESRALAALPAPPTNAKNVLLLVLDTVRADHLSAYGYGRDTTPNLAKLAASGVRFDRAVSTAPWTLPSHASMFTGRWPHELSTAIDQPLDDEFPTLAEFLAARGYSTAGFAANTYYCNTVYGLDRGFAHYEDFPENTRISPLEIFRSSALGRRISEELGLSTEPRPGEPGTRKTAAGVNADLLRWVDRRAGRPFFAFVNYYDAHGPYQPPEGSPRRFGLSQLSESEREEIMRKQRRLDKDGSGANPDLVRAVNDRATALRVDSYDDCLASLDREIGRLFADLERRGLRDNTVIVVTSDHGEHFGEHSLFGHGVSLYQPEIHVPLLLFTPDAPRGHVVSEPVSLRDLSATIAERLGHGTTSPFPGQSLARHFGAEHAHVHAEPILVEVERQKKFSPTSPIPAARGPVRGIVAKRWVYIRNADGSEELYDVHADPKQTKNLADHDPAAMDLARLRIALDEKLVNDPDAPSQVADAEGDGKVPR